MLSERERLIFDEIAANLSGVARSSRRRRVGSRILMVIGVGLIAVVAAVAAAWTAVGLLTVVMLASTAGLMTVAGLGLVIAVLMSVGLLRAPTRRKPSPA